MDSYLDINNNYFGVRHYKVHVTKEKIKPLRFITSVICYIYLVITSWSYASCLCCGH